MKLSAEPDPASIAVTMNGGVLPRTGPTGEEQWRYDPAIRSLILSSTLPVAAGVNLEATYRAACL